MNDAPKHSSRTKMANQELTTEQRLVLVQERFSELANNLPEAFWLIDASERRVVYANHAYETLWGSSVEGVYSDRFDWLRNVHPEDVDRLVAAVQKNPLGGIDEEFRVVHGDGTQRWVHLRSFACHDAAGRVHTIGGIASDITAPRQTAIIQHAVIDALPANVSIIDSQGRIVATNAPWQKFIAAFAFPSAACGIGANYYEQCALAPDKQREEANNLSIAIRAVLAGQEKQLSLIHACRISQGEHWFRTLITPWSADGARGAIIAHIDITDSIQAEQRLTQLTCFDGVTGLPNRRQFCDRLTQEIAQAQRRSTHLALLHINLDRFKLVNESLGHNAGDALLLQTGQRLLNTLRGTDTVGRLGSDDFAVILVEPEGDHDVLTSVRRLESALSQVFLVDGQELFISASIGIALYPDDGVTLEMLLENAATAMYRAKDLGRNNKQFYTAAKNLHTKERLHLEMDLRKAQLSNEFELYFQAKMNCQNGSLAGFEALLRWNHPVLGLMEPAGFIDLLEETGLIIPVGTWVLRQACRQVAQWHGAGLGKPTLSVNISLRQFHSPQLCEQIREILKETALPPAALELDLTESVLMADTEKTIETLRQLKDIGVRIAIDDFGTGYSSLSYLKRFALDAVKVDRAFVQDITADPGDVSITRAVITMAHSLKLQVLAEGVETEGQLALLIANHCDQFQGFFFSPAIPAAGAEQLLREGRCLPPAMVSGGERSRTLLLVDDEANILTALKRLLRRDGYTIITADSGLAGLELLASQPVDVIISDQRMPGMTGVEFLRRAKEIYPATIRMVLSGYTELQSVTDAINEGAIYKFLTKPWDDEQLRENIAEAFRHKEIVDENRQLSQKLQLTNQELAVANERLAALLAKKQQELSRDHTSLDIMQELLQQIPWPLLGIDDSGMIASTNHAAEILLSKPGGLLGRSVNEVLPTELTQFIDTPDSSPVSHLLINQRMHAVRCHAMGSQSASQGHLLLLVPEE